MRRDHDQIRRETALALELAQHGVVVRDDLQQHLGGNVLGVLGAERHTAQVGGVVNRVVNQAEKAVHEFVPGGRFLRETAVQEFLVHLRERHGRVLQRAFWEEADGRLTFQPFYPDRAADGSP